MKPFQPQPPEKGIEKIGFSDECYLIVAWSDAADEKLEGFRISYDRLTHPFTIVWKRGGHIQHYKDNISRKCGGHSESDILEPTAEKIPTQRIMKDLESRKNDLPEWMFDHARTILNNVK